MGNNNIDAKKNNNNSNKDIKDTEVDENIKEFGVPGYVGYKKNLLLRQSIHNLQLLHLPKLFQHHLLIDQLHTSNPKMFLH